MTESNTDSNGVAHADGAVGFSITGTVAEWPDSALEDALAAIDAHEGDVNFAHVHFSAGEPQKNAIERARSDELARETVVKLASRQFYLYNHVPGRSSFVARRRIPTLWKPLVDGQFVEHPGTGVIYGLEESLNPDGRQKLLVVFSAMNDPIFQWSLHRYAARNYNSIQKYISPSTTIMRPVDLGGVVGNFYLNTSVLPDNAVNVQTAIRSVMAERSIDPDDVVLLGSSKGGTAAVYHGLSMGMKHVAVDPILDETEYWEKLDDWHFTRETIFPQTKQEVFAKLFSTLQGQGAWDSAMSHQVLITSKRSQQYRYVRAALVDSSDRNQVFINDNPGIRSHPDVPRFSLHTATAAVDQLLSGVPLVPGHFTTD